MSDIGKSIAAAEARQAEVLVALGRQVREIHQLALWAAVGSWIAVIVAGIACFL